MGVIRTHNQNKLKPGSSNGTCAICGFKFKREDLRKRWDNQIVCRKHWESKHPMIDYRYRARDEGAGNKAYGRVDDAGTATGTDVSGNPIPPTITITTTSLNLIGVGSAFSQEIETDLAADTVTTTWSVSAGSLPTGLTIAQSELDSTNGTLSGTPTAGGAYSFTLKVTAPDGRTDTQAYSGTVGLGEPASWSSSTIPQEASGAQPGLNIMSRTYFSLSGGVPQVGSHSTSVVGDILDEDAETWGSMAALSGNSYNDCATCINRSSDGKDYLVVSLRGGNTLYYDVAGDSWTSISNQGYFTSKAIAASDSGRYVWTFGGNEWATSLNVDTVKYLDTTTWSWSTTGYTLPKKLMGHFAIELTDGTILVGGGRETNLSGSINLTCWIFDPSDGSFTATGSLPSGYKPFNNAFMLTNGDGYVAGGYDSVTNKLTYTYSASAGTWSAGVDLPWVASSYPTASRDFFVAVMPSGNLISKRVDGLGSGPYVSST